MATPSRHPFPSRGFLTLLVAASLLWGLGVIAFLGGLGATPYDTTDSAGRPMGFNDPFSREHYGIILRNISLAGTVRRLDSYDAVFVLMHLAVAALIWRAGARQWLLGLCALQPLIFPWGVLGLVYLPLSAFAVLAGSPLDREGFDDVPFACLVGHAVWLGVCGLVAWRCWRSRPPVKHSP